MALRLVVLVLAVAGGFAAGRAVGAQDAPGAPAADALRRAAALASFPRAYADAFAAEWRDGFLAGGAKGVLAGRDRGLREGRKAGDAAARAARPRVPEPVTHAEVERVPPPPEADPTGDVLVVGDSLEVLTSPYLQRYLPGVRLTIEAHGGYSSPQLYEVFRRSFRPEHDVVVFDAGTNDSPLYPQILAGRLEAVAGAVGDRCMVVPTIHSYVVDGVGDEGKNRVVRAFAASRPGTQTPDWQAAVAANPDKMQPDDLHPNAEGADLRARLVAEGVAACLRLQEGLG